MNPQSQNSFYKNLASLLYSLFVCAASFAQTSGTDPEKVFRNPPEAAKPGVLWMWMGNNLSKEGITKDLEALKKEGFIHVPPLAS